MTDFLIQVILDPSKATSGNKKVRSELKKTETAAGRVEKQLKRAFTVTAIAVGVRKIGQLADAYTNVQNRLRTVTDGQEELAFATERLFEIADRTRSSFEGTAEVYARVGLAAQNLGRDQEELLNFTESLNQAVILSGASSIEARAGLIQLSQGLASGALRGEELNSVLEQIPVVADVIAQSLGVTRGELRRLGQEGKIDAEIVLDAFKEAREELSGKFAETVPTLGQSFEVLGNNLIRFVGDLDEATGASSTTSSAVIALAENLDTVALSAGTAGAVFAAIRFGPAAAEALAAVSAFVKLRVAILAGNAVVLGSAEAARQQAVAEAEAAAAIAGKTAVALANLEVEAARGLVVRGSAQATFIQAALDKQLTAATTANTAAQEAFTASQIKRAAATKAATVQARLLSLVNPFTGLLVAGVAATVLIKEIADGFVEVEERILKIQEAGNKIGLSEFGKVGDDILRFEEKLAVVQENIDRDIETKGFANPVALKKAEEYKKKLEELGAQQGFLADGTASTTVEARKQVEALNDLAEALGGAVEDIRLENDLLGLNSQERRIQVRLLKEIEQLQKKGGPELTDAQKAELEAEIRRNQALQDQADVLERIAGPQQQYEQDLTALNALLASGKIDQEQFNAELADMNETLSGVDFQELGLDGVGVDLRDLASTTRVLEEAFAAGRISAEEYAAALRAVGAAARNAGGGDDDESGFVAGIRRIREEIKNTDQVIEDTLVDGFHDARDSLKDFLKTGEFEFSSFVDTLLDGATELLANQLLLALIGGGPGSGGAGLIGSLFGFGGGKAAGGPVDRNQSFLVGEEGPELFRPPGAGEVVPAGETAAMLARQGAQSAPVVNVAPPAVNVINVNDPSEIPAGMDSPAGETVIMNTLSRNRRKVRSISGQ